MRKREVFSILEAGYYLHQSFPQDNYIKNAIGHIIDLDKDFCKKICKCRENKCDGCVDEIQQKCWKGKYKR